MIGIARSMRFLAKALTAESSPEQVALGCSIGIMLGLVPKGNLTAVILLALLFLLRVNILAGLVSTAIFTCVGLLCTSGLDWFGEHILTIGALQPIYAWLYEAPVIPWTDFNNTVTAGGFVIGLFLVFPVYRILTGWFAKNLPGLSRTARSFELGRALFDDDKEMTSWRVG